MIVLARLLVRVLSFLLLAALAIAGLAAAIFCIQGGTNTLSLDTLAELAQLPDVEGAVGPWLDQLEAPGTMGIAALSALGAILLGLLLLAGVLVPRRERLLTLHSGDDGTIAARRRGFAQLATGVVEQTRGVTGARVKARPGRRGGGRLRVTAEHTRTADRDQVERAVQERLTPLAEPFGLKTQVRTRLGDRGSRVQ